MTDAPSSSAGSRSPLRWLAAHGAGVIGWSELLGGLATAIWIGVETFLIRGVRSPTWVLPYALSFCVLSAVAGILLLRRRRHGRLLSAVVQLVQLVRFSVGGVTWVAAAGLALTVLYAEPRGWDFIAAVTVGFRLTPRRGIAWELGLNFFSLWALFHLWRSPARAR